MEHDPFIDEVPIKSDDFLSLWQITKHVFVQNKKWICRFQQIAHVLDISLQIRECGEKNHTENTRNRNIDGTQINISDDTTLILSIKMPKLLTKID